MKSKKSFKIELSSDQVNAKIAKRCQKWREQVMNKREKVVNHAESQQWNQRDLMSEVT